MNAADGTLETLDGRSRIRFERRLSHPVERVWAALTEPGEMRKWWATADELELREGGRFTIRWLNGRSTVSATRLPWATPPENDTRPPDRRARFVLLMVAGAGG